MEEIVQGLDGVPELAKKGDYTVRLGFYGLKDTTHFFEINSKTVKMCSEPLWGLA